MTSPEAPTKPEAAAKLESEPKKALIEFRGPGKEGNWYAIETDPSDKKEKDNAQKNRELLNNTLLASLQIQHIVVLCGCGCSLCAGGPSMGDLWQAAVGDPPSPSAVRIARRVHHDLSEKNIELFLSKIEAYLQVNDVGTIKRFLNTCKKVILEKCSDFLNHEKLEAHRTFLHRLSRRRRHDQRLKIFTTNYDLCFEGAAAAIGGVAVDGFSFSAPRRYDPRFFCYDIVRRPRSAEATGDFLEGVFHLYKIHGSVNWERDDKGIIYEKEGPDPSKACLIYPATGKYQQSFTQPHLESMAQYLAALREPNTCMLVVGFGFNDDHLAEPLLAAVQSNPHMRLIIVDPGAKLKAEDGNHYWEEFGRLCSQDDDIWFIAARFGEFAKLIPDLKSLTPADNLLRAVRGVTGKP